MEIPPPIKLSLTPRETEVLRLVVNGHKNKVIASELGISLQTTKNHVSHLLTKLNVRSRLELALMVRTNEKLTVEKHIHEASPLGKAEVPASPLTPRQTEILYYI